MAQTVFFSWQADTPNRISRNFIREVLEGVCKDIATDTNIDEALRDMSVDSDTQNVAGQPPIADTIFKKIDASKVFVGDMTFVGKRIDKRPTPNPNVLIEYGWALKSKTHERVILVMNTAYGEPSEQNLPFNLRHVRWPITFHLPKDASPDEKAKVKLALVKILGKAVLASLGTVPPASVEQPKPFPQAEKKDGPARFRARGESLGIQDDGFPFGAEKEIRLLAGPAMWFRLMPVADTGKRWPPHELKKYAITDNRTNLAALGGNNSANFLRADDGFGLFAGYSREESKNNETIETDWVTFAFETGEVWAIDTIILSHGDWLPYIEGRFADRLQTYTRFLECLGLKPPFRWIAGMVGVKGRKMTMPPPPPGRAYFENRGPVCVADEISAEGIFDGQQTPSSALHPLFEKYFEKCGWKRPDHLPQ